MRTLFAVISSCKTKERIKAICETWAPIPLESPDILFFGGKGFGNTTPKWPREPRLILEQIELPVEDNYVNLPLKVQAMFRWAVDHDYDYIWKLDDDVYAVPDLLLKVPKEHYVGRFRQPSDTYPAEYASGFAYRLSQKAANVVAKAPYNGDWAEDRFIGNTLAAAGFRGFQVGNFLAPVYPPLQPEVIVRTNARFSGAFCEAPNNHWMLEMHRYHQHFVAPELKQVQPPKIEVIAHKKVTPEQIAHPPFDQPDRRKNA